jgi:diphosphate-dependent phosphofructokinase
MRRMEDWAETFSPLQRTRLSYVPPLPRVLAGPTRLEHGAPALPSVDADRLKGLFPHTYGKPTSRLVAAAAPAAGGAGAGSSGPVHVGCVLSGGQAAGGHNVIAGLFDAIKRFHPDSK